MEALGKIIAILPPQNGVSQQTGNAWSAQTYVLETSEQYPKKIPFEVFGDDKIAKYNIQMGETLTIQFDIDSREWNGKWFPRIRCYNVLRMAIQSPQVERPSSQDVPAAQPKVDNTPASNTTTVDTVDDLPF